MNQGYEIEDFAKKYLKECVVNSENRKNIRFPKESWSSKNVIPVVMLVLSYSDMEIIKGNQVTTLWRLIIDEFQ